MPNDQQNSGPPAEPIAPVQQQSTGQQPVRTPPPQETQVADQMAPEVQRLEAPRTVAPLTPELIQRLAERLTEARDKHDLWIDPLMFNGSTILVLFLAAAAAFIPSLGDGTAKWIAPLCAGLAGVFVAMERALGFGARWRYHRDMYYGYSAIIDMLEFYPAIPPSEQSKYGRDIFMALYALRSRESAVPNAGMNSSPT